LRETKTKEGFIVNLKDLIKRSKKKMKKVDKRLEDQAKEKRNFEREEKAREYYEKAMRLYDKGKFEDAKELWEKAIKITEHPEMEGYIRKSVKRDKKKEKAMLEEEKRRLKRLEIERGFSAKEVEKRYKTAISDFKKEKYLAAKLKFEEVEDMFPDHKATRSYMKLIQQMIDEEQEGLIDDALRKEVFASSKQRKEAWKKNLERKEKERRQQLAAQAELVYQEAMKFYKSKKYEEAKDRFKEVEWILPDYKKTIKYLKKLDKTVAEKGLAYSEEEKIKYFGEN